MTGIAAQVLDLSWKDAWRTELRGPDGKWITGPEHNETYMKAATGRRAGAIRLHDYVIYGKTELRPGGFGLQSRVMPMEVTGLHHHWEKHGRKRYRYTDMDLRDPETGETHSESVKDGSAVKLFPREDIKTMLAAEKRGTPAPRPAPAPRAAPKSGPDPGIVPGEVLYHGTNKQYKPGDIIDAQHADPKLRRLQEDDYAFASTDPAEASFFGETKAGPGGTAHTYRVEPVGSYERDPHMGGSTASRRSRQGFRVVSEVENYTGKPLAARPAPRPKPPAPSPPSPPPLKGGELSGMDLWLSGEGAVKDETPAEDRAARNVWYNDTFSYTNNYLRHGTLPSTSSKAAIRALGGGSYGKARLALPPGAPTDDAYIRDIRTLQGLMSRAPAFSRPAVMYRDITDPDQVFGPVGSMKGRVFSDKGFVSATTDMGSAERYGEQGGTPDKIIVHVPAGGRAFRSGRKFSPDYTREKEYTFPPGSRFRVDDDKIVGGNRQTTVTLVVPPGTQPGPKPAPVVPQILTRQPWEGYAGHKYNSETGELVA